jgi:hypothetical protein
VRKEKAARTEGDGKRGKGKERRDYQQEFRA